MSRWLFAAIMMLSASGVMFGLDWRPVPAPHYQPVTRVAVVNPSLPVPGAADTAPGKIPAAAVAKSAEPVKVAEPAKIVTGAQPIPPTAEFKTAAPLAASPPLFAANPPPAADPSPPPAEAGPPSSDMAAAEPAPKCDVAACQAAYFTFRVSDCTYQPSNGERRFCNKGNPQRAALPDEAHRAQASACNVAACRRAYFSFNAADCTYQPSDGPRRVCTK